MSNQNKSKFYRFIGKSIGIGIAAEIMGIGAGYWLYKKYTNDEGAEFC